MIKVVDPVPPQGAAVSSYLKAHHQFLKNILEGHQEVLYLA